MRRPRIPKVDPPRAITAEAEAPVPEHRKRLKRTPELELALGARIRAGCIAAGLSQSAVGAAVGISWQQVQKDEKGADRVAASTLQGIAAAVDVHPELFFEEDRALIGAIPDVKTAMRLGQRIQRVRDPAVLKRMLALADVLAEAEEGQPAAAGDWTP